MKVIKRTSRWVVVIPAFGIAIKFPCIYFWAALCVAYEHARIGRLRYAWRRKVYSGIVGVNNIRADLFRGIEVNWGEYQFYAATHHAFVQPTYFSFFGLVNIQYFGNPCVGEWRVWKRKMQEILGNKVDRDLHHFASPDNFTVVNGKLRMLDYGDRRTQKLIKRYSEVIMDNTHLFEDRR